LSKAAKAVKITAVPDGKSPLDTPTPLLIVSRDFGLYDAFKRAAPPGAFNLVFCPPDEDCLALAAEHGIRVVLIDPDGPLPSALPLLRRLKKSDPLLDVLLAGEAPGPEEILDLIHQGATDVLAKPFRREALQEILDRIEAKRELRRETLQLERRLERKYVFENMVSRNPIMREAFSLIEQIAKYFSSVLITGETGTGKDMAARAIHALSPGRDRPLVICDCAAVPESLFESELFGYRRGAFTGADHDKRGLFEEADGGVILLDEIAEIPAQVQAKLLRVLESRQFRPLGAADARTVDVRVIAATNRDLAAGIRSGAFREDLFHRLNRVEIHLPPLRERREDIPLLIRHLLPRFNRRFGKTLKGVSRDVQKIAHRYHWPGNVRELENVLESAALICRKDFIDVADLPKYLRDYKSAEPRVPFLGRESLCSLDDLERDYIIYLLKTTRKNLKKTSETLGISRTTLYNKIRKYKIAT
jgi:DNA-binding NtrC family response regulator